jgi:hypothetical protein
MMKIVNTSTKKFKTTVKVKQAEKAKHKKKRAEDSGLV